MKGNKSYSFALVAAFLVHLGMVGVLLISSKDKTIIASAPVQAHVKETIEAVTIDESILQKEIARLEDIEKVKKQKEVDRKRKIERENKALADKRKQEQERLAKLKEENIKYQEQKKLDKIAEIESRAKLKLEKQKLAALKKEKELIVQQKKEAQERAKQAELKRQLAEKERKKLEEIAKKEEQERLKKLAQEKEKQLKLEQERANRARVLTQNQIAQYAGLMQAKIHQNWRQPLGTELDGLKCKLSVKLSESGEVLGAQVVESSGNKEFDRSSELAVMKSSPLPMPVDDSAKQQFKKFTFTFNPEAA